jgi:anti-anti-sigma regulatory factor
MPKYQHRIELHRLFLVERRGNTFIVAPKGDPAGFANLNFNMEHAGLLALLAKNPNTNVLVDLGGSNYFGAKILGAMSEWADQAQSQGGEFAVCALSADMKELLRIFDFEDRWKQYPTREAAVKAVVKESPLQVVGSHLVTYGFAACLLAALGLSFLPWGEYYNEYLNQRDYATVTRIWDDMNQLKSANAPPSEWRKLQSRASRELDAIVPQLDARAGTDTEQALVAQCLLFAVKDNILKRLLVRTNRLDQYRPTDSSKEIFWVHTSIYIEKARRIMQGEDTSDLNFPQESEIVHLANGNGTEGQGMPQQPLIDNPAVPIKEPMDVPANHPIDTPLVFPINLRELPPDVPGSASLPRRPAVAERPPTLR